MIDLARLCEAMRDRLYSIGATAIGNPGVALTQALDAAAAELRRQREEGAAQGNGEEGRGQKEHPTSMGYSGLVGAAAFDQSTPTEKPYPVPASPSPASSAPAADREGVASEVRDAWWAGIVGVPPWGDLNESHRDTYRRIADYVLQRESKLRDENVHLKWVPDYLTMCLRGWHERCESVESDRATLRAQVEQLTAELAAMRSVVEAAQEWQTVPRYQDHNAVVSLCDALAKYHERARLKAQGKP